MDAWEYKTIVFETGGWIRRGQIDENDIDHTLNRLGSEGWESVGVVPVSDGSAGTKNLVVLLKRKKSS